MDLAMMDLSRTEFETWMNLLREDIKDVSVKLEALGGRVGSSETKIAVLEDRSTRHVYGAGGLGAGAGVIVAMAWEWLKTKL